MKQAYKKIMITPLAVQSENMVLAGTVTNADMTINQVTVDGYYDEDGVTFDFDNNSIY